MAFDVTPTSGVGPYTFTADFSNKGSFDLGYTLRFSRSNAMVDVCPPAESTDFYLPTPSSTLLSVGQYIRTESVSVGSCMSFKLDILNPLGIVVETQLISISNIE